MFKSDVEAVDAFVDKYRLLKNEIAKVIVGQDEIIQHLVISIFSRGHCLLVGVPGLAKTLMVNTLSKVLGLSYSRIQFTPDLMPSDIIGTEILDENRKFRFIKGPVFANIILADEINRTPPKTQSALLEAMQEKAVTVAGVSYVLEEPFFVLATQNPIEHEGTYPLPEAQLDRFMFNVWLDYPQFKEEIDIVNRTTIDADPDPKKILTSEEILYFQHLMRKIPVADNVVNYAVTLTSKTRPGNPDSPEVTKKYITWGAGPRASQYLIIGAKTHAAVNGKYSPDIEDVRAVAIPILRHRILRNYKSEADGVSVEEIIRELVK
ncbi:MAG: AAA family ATPase [Bacteroidetes bacterium]|nr:AAA family ATPase [Bacteroidota bacterium]